MKLPPVLRTISVVTECLKLAILVYGQHVIGIFGFLEPIHLSNTLEVEEILIKMARRPYVGDEMVIKILKSGVDIRK